MDIIQLITLAIVQGFTEFLPVSSSAHLILTPALFNWPDQGLAFDVAVHLGTLIAVSRYFRNDLKKLSRAWLNSITHKQHCEESRLAWGILYGTLPLAIIGFTFKDMIENDFRSANIIASSTIIFAIALWYAYASGQQKRDEYSLSVKDILIIGCAQAIALIPGTSRSGITITAAMMLGLTAQSAARFSFLLSIPAILLPGGYKTMQLSQSNISIAWGELFIATLLSAIFAYLCIKFFLKLLDTIGMLPFIIYRFLLGIFLFIVFA